MAGTARERLMTARLTGLARRRCAGLPAVRGHGIAGFRPAGLRPGGNRLSGRARQRLKRKAPAKPARGRTGRKGVQGPARRLLGHGESEGDAGGVDELTAAPVTVTGLLGQDPGEHLIHLWRQLRTQGD